MSPFLPRTVLVTGALGYIGSHTVVELLLSDLCINVIAVDNLSNSSLDVVNHIQDTVAACTSSHCMQDRSSRLRFIEADVTDERAMRDIFSQSYCKGPPISAVIHFAALKSVVESIQQPLKYYRENVGGLTTLLGVMQDWDCKHMILSSSATVYGSLSGSSRCTEDLCRHTSTATDLQIKGIQGCIGLSNAYARTKYFCEAILQDECAAQPDFKAMALRYFNPVGCHSVGLLRESPRGVPGNLVPCILLAMKEEREVRIFGTDYNTPDGSAVRDFIHVVDLAQGHVAALEKLIKETVSHTLQLSDSYPWYEKSSSSSDSGSAESSVQASPMTDTFGPDTPPTPSSISFHHFDGEEEFKPNSLQVYNLGTGCGSTVKQVLAAMRAASGHAIPAIEAARRPGDIECSVADPSKANKELGWYASRTIQDACRDLCR